jgi:hypothetical protein
MRTTATAALTAVLLLTTTACGGSSGDKAEPAPTVTVTKEPEPAPEPLTEEETIEQCTDAVAEAAPEWDDWSIPIEGWEDDPETPEVCKTLDTRDYMDAFLEGLNIAAACDTPDALPGRC